MTISKRIFRAAILVACSSAPTMLVASDEPPAPTLKSETVLVVPTQAGAVDGKGEAKVERVLIVTAAPVAGDDETTKVAESPVATKEVSTVEARTTEDEEPTVWLGISLKEVGGDLATFLGSSEGVLVQSILPDSPALEAELQEGDLIIAFNGEKMSGPPSLIEALRKYGKEQSEEHEKAEKQENKYPPVELTIMRRGKEMRVRITPSSRPEATQLPVADAEHRGGNDLAELETLFRDLRSQGTAKVFRFGSPLTLKNAPFHDSQRHGVTNFVVVVKDADGKTIEIRVERENENPPKITLKEGGQLREIGVEEIDQLPEKVRKSVADAIKRFESHQRDHVAQAARAAEHAQRAAKQHAEAAKQVERAARQQAEHAENLREEMLKHRDEMQKQRGKGFLPHPPTPHLHEPRVAIVGPDGMIDLNQSTEELARKFRKLADDVAQRAAKNVHDFADMPQQIQQLRSQIDELKKQVTELQEQLQEKTDKK